MNFMYEMAKFSHQILLLNNQKPTLRNFRSSAKVLNKKITDNNHKNYQFFNKIQLYELRYVFLQ